MDDERPAVQARRLARVSPQARPEPGSIAGSRQGVANTGVRGEGHGTLEVPAGPALVAGQGVSPPSSPCARQEM